MKMSVKENIKTLLNRSWPYLAILLVTFLMIQGQVSSHGFVMNIDTWFHYSRFYDVSEQIRTGHFNYFQMNYGYSQSGRIINALYGPLFAYFMGGIVLLTGTWYKFQIISYIIICFLGGFGMYKLTKKANISKIWGSLLSLIYINISPIQNWFDHSNLAAWGAALAPFVFIEAINMVQNPNKPIRWVRLMLVMAIVAETHILTTAILAVALVPFAIVGFVRASQKSGMIFDLLKAMIGCLCLTANVWGALLIIGSTNKLAMIRQHNLASNSVSLSNTETIRDTIFTFVLIIFLAQIIYVLFTLKRSILNDTVTLVGALFLLISSELMPWSLIQKKLPILQHYLQFPHRFTVVAYCLLLLGIGLSINNLTVKSSKYSFYTVLAGLILVLVQALNVNYSRLTQTSTSNYMPIYRVINKKYYQTTNPSKQKKYISYIKGIGKEYHVSGMTPSGEGVHYIHTFTTNNNFYRNTSNLALLNEAARWKSKGHKLLLTLIIKVNPDYLPVTKQDAGFNQVNAAFEKQVINQSYKFKKMVLSNGSLKLSWIGKKEAKRRLPIVMYKQSSLKLNGRNVHPLKYSLICAPTVHQKVGNNTAVLSFKWPTSFKVLFVITIISWLIMIVVGIKALVLKVKEFRH